MSLTHHDQAEIQRIVSNWKLTPATLAHKLSRGAWIPSPHLLYISKTIASAIARGNARIIISAPPRHGKSQLIDIYTPIWVLELFKEYSVILASYGAELSEGFGREVRDIVTQNEALLDVRLTVAKSNIIETATNGVMYSVGLGGAITGRGANVLLIDDYIKEIKEALSPTYREYVWNWFTTTAYTRLEPGGSVIIIATRWHTDDLIGRILQNFWGQWTNIVLPAEAEEGDILGRPLGAPLFPERYPLQRLAEIKEVLGGQFYQALYQQKPVDEGNKIADGSWLKVTDVLPDRKLRKIRVWDLASTEGGGDYTTGALCSYDPSNGYFYIENIVRKQLSPSNIETEVRKCAVEDGQDIKVGIEQEPGSSGKLLVNHYAVTVLPEFTVVPIPSTGQHSKVIRAQPLLAAAEAGKVVMVRAHWNREYVKEFDAFPAGSYDDQIDTTAAAYTNLSGKKVFSATWGRGASNTSSIERARSTIKRDGNKGIKAASFQLSARRSVSWGR